MLKAGRKMDHNQGGCRVVLPTVASSELFS